MHFYRFPMTFGGSEGKTSLFWSKPVTFDQMMTRMGRIGPRIGWHFLVTNSETDRVDDDRHHHRLGLFLGVFSWLGWAAASAHLRMCQCKIKIYETNQNHPRNTLFFQSRLNPWRPLKRRVNFMLLQILPSLPWYFPPDLGRSSCFLKSFEKVFSVYPGVGVPP